MSTDVDMSLYTLTRVPGVGVIQNMALKALSIGTIFAVGIGLYFLSAILPQAISNVFGANTTDWDTGTVALWGLIPLAVIGLVVFHFMPSGRKGE